MIRRLLETTNTAKTDLDAVAVGKGPGSFTGLRIAVGVSQALAYALDIPVVGISSLEALAAGYSRLDIPLTAGDGLFICLDARMGEVYCACFTMGERDMLSRSAEDQLLSPQQAAALAAGCQYGIGSALKLESLSEVEFVNTYPDAAVHASDICQLAKTAYQRGEFDSSLKLEPAYLRRETAWKKLEQQRA